MMVVVVLGFVALAAGCFVVAELEKRSADRERDRLVTPAEHANTIEKERAAHAAVRDFKAFQDAPDRGDLVEAAMYDELWQAHSKLSRIDRDELSER